MGLPVVNAFIAVSVNGQRPGLLDRKDSIVECHVVAALLRLTRAGNGVRPGFFARLAAQFVYDRVFIPRHKAGHSCRESRILAAESLARIRSEDFGHGPGHCQNAVFHGRHNIASGIIDRPDGVVPEDDRIFSRLTAGALRRHIPENSRAL